MDTFILLMSTPDNNIPAKAAGTKGGFAKEAKPNISIYEVLNHETDKKVSYNMDKKSLGKSNKS